MIQIKPITTTDKQHYQYVEELLITSFPSQEYRNLDALRQYTDNKPNFLNNIILDDGVPIGLITYWEFGTFYYVEHFAIDPMMRNKGYGQKVLYDHYLRSYHPTVLEVEEPNDEMSKRRIQFYQRLGFVLWEDPYFQPPYRENDNSLPMHLMVYGNLNSQLHFNEIKNKIHTEVYNVAK